ncbi:MAG: MAPEG family protein, partial [Pseudomonadota bacterium]
MTVDALILLAMAAHVALSAALYCGLTLARAPAVWGIGSPDGWFAVREAAIAANLSNQFEWPIFFHTVCVLTLTGGTSTPLFAAVAWAFILARVAHTLVQVGGGTIRLRGIVFSVNFVAVLVLWALYGTIMLS